MVSIPALPSGLSRSRRHRVANRLHSLSIRLLRAVRESDAASGLSGPRLSLLSIVVFAGPTPVTRLAAMEGVSPAAITKMAQALEAQGLVTRSREGQDQRVVF